MSEKIFSLEDLKEFCLHIDKQNGRHDDYCYHGKVFYNDFVEHMSQSWDYITDEVWEEEMKNA